MAEILSVNTGYGTPNTIERLEVAPPTAQRGEAVNISLSQWSMESNDRFRPCGPTTASLPAGVYGVNADDRGVHLQQMSLVTDHLIETGDPTNKQVLQSIRTFWGNAHEYHSRGIVYKRGILLWGPAGSGKTATITLLTQELVKRGGIVIYCSRPDVTSYMLPQLRRIEPDRPLIVIFEDIEEMVANNGEHSILAMLDGEHQIGNVVNLATTNYPEKLGARIVNRPSRFDERIFVGLPSATAREIYLRHLCRNEDIDEKRLLRWVKDTATFSMAHLRELVVAVFCLRQPYAEVLERLKDLHIQPKSGREFSGGLAGFSAEVKKVLRVTQ